MASVQRPSTAALVITRSPAGHLPDRLGGCSRLHLLPLLSKGTGLALYLVSAERPVGVVGALLTGSGHALSHPGPWGSKQDHVRHCKPWPSRHGSLQLPSSMWRSVSVACIGADCGSGRTELRVSPLSLPVRWSCADRAAPEKL